MYTQLLSVLEREGEHCCSPLCARKCIFQTIARCYSTNFYSMESRKHGRDRSGHYKSRTKGKPTGLCSRQCKSRSTFVRPNKAAKAKQSQRGKPPRKKCECQASLIVSHARTCICTCVWGAQLSTMPQNSAGQASSVGSPQKKAEGPVARHDDVRSLGFWYCVWTMAAWKAIE